MPLIIPANSAVSGGFDVDNSLRFDDGSSDFLSKTVSSGGNQKTWTFSAWIKKTQLSGSGGYQTIFSADKATANSVRIKFDANANDNKFEVYYYTGSMQLKLTTNRLFKDVSAWYHIVLAVDTTQGTASNRVKLYVNGVQETSFATATYPSQNLNTSVNEASSPHQVANGGGNLYFNGYLSEVCLIDGSQLAADSFGEFDEDSGIWKPIKISGLTFGTNGFHLEFKQAGTGTNASGMGADTSGEDNHFAVNNLTAIDQSTDTCTNNFATLNPLNYSSSSKTYAFGNTAITASASGSWNATLSNFAVSSGKWYTEYKITAVGSFSAIGVGYQPFNTNASAYLGSTFLVGEDTGSFGWRNNGARPQGGSNLSSWGTNDILMIAIDMDNQKLYFGKNGTWETSGNPESGATGTGSIGNLTAGEDYLFVICPRGGGTSVNFGSPSFAISSGNADGDGFGNLEYAVPSGYFALCTKNLAEYG